MSAMERASEAGSVEQMNEWCERPSKWPYASISSHFYPQSDGTKARLMIE